jgi:hypothetical protein
MIHQSCATSDRLMCISCGVYEIKPVCNSCYYAKAMEISPVDGGYDSA